MSLVGKKFPDITVKAINRIGEVYKLNVLEEAIAKKQKVLLFWYPKDFTFVCPTELHAFQEANEEFRDRNTVIIAASCDTAEVHFAWLTTDRDNGGIRGVNYPILSDSTRILARELNILDDEDNVTYRATYLLDEDGMVFHESVNDMPIGRNVHEYIRLIDAYSHVQSYGEVCPANWKEGKEALRPNKLSVAEYLRDTASKSTEDSDS